MGWFRRAVFRMIDVTRTHPFWSDVAFAVLIGTVSLASTLTTEPEGSQRPADWFAVALVISMTGVLAFRRRHPLAAVIACAPPQIAFWVSDYPTTFDVFSVLTVYAATAHGGDDRDRVWRVTSVVVTVFTAVALLGVLSPEDDLPPLAVLGIVVIFGMSAAVGELVHQRRRREADLESRARRAESERELLARQAVLDERARIARDMHDIVAHGISVIVVQAGAAERLVDAHPERAKQALVSIQDAGREALSEMRRMLGLLRDRSDDPRLAPQPTLADVEQLIRNCVDSGVPTELRIDGDRPERTTTREMTGYRVVQEALTNVIKHAGANAQAAVRITYAPDQMRIEVTDDGAGTSTETLERATGHGLIGMRERVELYQGTLHAGPRPGGGFRIAATIPFDGSAA